MNTENLESDAVRHARETLAAMPAFADIDNPYEWLGQLKSCLGRLLASPGQPAEDSEKAGTR